MRPDYRHAAALIAEAIAMLDRASAIVHGVDASQFTETWARDAHLRNIREARIILRSVVVELQHIRLDPSSLPQPLEE